ncbi:MAG: hypothetical protein ABI794_01615 [Betaproteobacteria bacterium]
MPGFASHEFLRETELTNLTATTLERLTVFTAGMVPFIAREGAMAGGTKPVVLLDPLKSGRQPSIDEHAAGGIIPGRGRRRADAYLADV